MTFQFDPVSATVLIPPGKADVGDVVSVRRADGSTVEVTLGPFIGYESPYAECYSKVQRLRFAIEHPDNVRMFKAPVSALDNPGESR